jgi:hypothetical protein
MMSRQVATALCSAVFGFIASSSFAIAQQKAAAVRPETWQANAATSRASGVAKKVYVAQRRDDGALTRPTAAPSTPTPLVAGSSNATRDRQFYSSIRDLMESMVDPSADTLWGAVGTVVDAEGTHELFPRTQEEWIEPRRAAVRIIEAGNLLMIPGREAAPAGAKSEAPGAELEPAQITALIRKNRKSFDAFAKALQGIGLAALQAIDAKDAALLMDVGARMENVCESCHQTFWYPPQKDASTGARSNRLNLKR